MSGEGQRRRGWGGAESEGRRGGPRRDAPEVVPPDAALLALVVEARADVVVREVRVWRAAAVRSQAGVDAGGANLGAGAVQAHAAARGRRCRVFGLGGRSSWRRVSAPADHAGRYAGRVRRPDLDKDGRALGDERASLEFWHADGVGRWERGSRVKEVTKQTAENMGG